MMIKLFRAFYMVLFSLWKNKIQLWLFTCSVMSNSLQPHGLQHTRLPSRSPPPGVCSNTCPFIQWCYPTISSSVIPFSSCLQSFPASGLFPVSQFFASDGQILEFQLQHQCFQRIYRTDFLSDGLTGYPYSPRDSQESSHHSPKSSILWRSAFFIVQLSRPYVTTGKTIPLTRQTFAGKVMSLHCNMLSRLITAFLPRSKCLLISWLQSPSAVILEPPKIKSVTVSIVSPSICQKWWDQIPWS